MVGFFGRTQEFEELEALLDGCSQPKNTIYIEGEGGMGKTLLADRLCDTEVAARQYPYRHRVSAYNSTWEQIMRTLGYAVLGPLYTKSVAKDLQEKIVNQACKGGVLICIDNLDNEAMIPGIKSLIGAWRDVERSVLLLTGQAVPDNLDALTYCKRFTLKGIKEVAELKKLVGVDLCVLLDTNPSLLDRVIQLTGGNPQKLLYLRWRAAKDDAELSAFLDRVENDNSEGKTATALEAIKTGLVKLKIPLEHFLAIANLRDPVFPGEVLALLWDRLGGGGAEYFHRSLDCLLQAGLINPQKTLVGKAGPESLGSAIQYRLNTTLHARLQKAFRALVAPERRAHIQYFLGDYFRNRFAKAYDEFLKNRKEGKQDKRQSFPIDDLNAYVHHTISGGFVDSAFQYLFSRGIIEWAHSAGSALGLKQILKNLELGLEKNIDNLLPSASRTHHRNELQDRLKRLKGDTKGILESIAARQQRAIPGALHHHVEGIESAIIDFLSLEKDAQRSKLRLEAMLANVYAALGRTFKDLNQHLEALNYLKKSLVSLDRLQKSLNGRKSPKNVEHSRPSLENEIDKLGTRRLKADIYHHMGIVYSVTGRSAECLEAYFKGAKYAADNCFFSARDALSLGYLAYELKFYDMKVALDLADAAVDQARRAEDDIVLAKNLCTKGQILSFMGKGEHSDHAFNEASRRLAYMDQREICRIKVDWAVNHIFEGNLPDAKHLLEYVIKNYEKTGDPRRVGIAKAYQGIIKYHCNEFKPGVDTILDAFENHRLLTTEREAIYEALTYLWMMTKGNFKTDEMNLGGALKKISNRTTPFGEISEDILSYLGGLDEAKHIYVRFWHRYYLPTLLTREKEK